MNMLSATWDKICSRICLYQPSPYFFLFFLKVKVISQTTRKANNFHNLKLKILQVVGCKLSVHGRVERAKENYPHNNHGARGVV